MRYENVFTLLTLLSNILTPLGFGSKDSNIILCRAFELNRDCKELNVNLLLQFIIQNSSLNLSTMTKDRWCVENLNLFHSDFLYL